MTESNFPPYLQPHTTTCNRGHETLRTSPQRGVPGKRPCPVCARAGAGTGLRGGGGSAKAVTGRRFGGGRIGYDGRGPRKGETL